jgi:hypothetical protein
MDFSHLEHIIGGHFELWCSVRGKVRLIRVCVCACVPAMNRASRNKKQFPMSPSGGEETVFRLCSGCSPTKYSLLQDITSAIMVRVTRDYISSFV